MKIQKVFFLSLRLFFIILTPLLANAGPVLKNSRNLSRLAALWQNRATSLYKPSYFSSRCIEPQEAVEFRQISSAHQSVAQSISESSFLATIKGSSFVKGKTMRVELKTIESTGCPIIEFSGSSDTFEKIRSILVDHFHAKELQMIDALDQVFVDYELGSHNFVLEWNHFGGITINAQQADDTQILKHLYFGFDELFRKNKFL